VFVLYSLHVNIQLYQLCCSNQALTWTSCNDASTEKKKNAIKECILKSYCNYSACVSYIDSLQVFACKGGMGVLVVRALAFNYCDLGSIPSWVTCELSLFDVLHSFSCHESFSLGSPVFLSQHSELNLDWKWLTHLSCCNRILFVRYVRMCNWFTWFLCNVGWILGENSTW